ncbi:MAG: hypothetical protein M3P49_09945 [Actinomycetota bacterium]|nr:hypothetical protein [Actinomycetota bacterium]
MEGLQASGRPRYGAYVHKAFGRLYLGLQPDLAGLEAGGELDAPEEGVQSDEVLWALDLGDQDQVESLPRLLDDLDDVPVEVRGVEGVHAVERRAGPPVELVDGTDHVPAGVRLFVRGHGVFKVEEYRVGVGGEGFLDHLLVGCGNRQKGSPDRRAVALRRVTVTPGHRVSPAYDAPSHGEVPTSAFP